MTTYYQEEGYIRMDKPSKKPPRLTNVTFLEWHTVHHTVYGDCVYYLLEPTNEIKPFIHINRAIVLEQKRYHSTCNVPTI